MKKLRNTILVAALIGIAIIARSAAQQRGSFNFAKRTSGEREGDLSPAAIAGVAIGVVAGIAGLMVTVFFCYHVYRKQKEQEDSFNKSFGPERKFLQA
ncbi:uncharacterized protein LOC129226075 [Uloborus diversus]|uniref:uncharacterized protein LOC129226075 n=1 Tax=Uloborus diversus TaxID=327109 RepID=UPI00240A4C89|nr:uncharacterized protein LOC129226075 [Uloborus diversus]